MRAARIAYETRVNRCAGMTQRVGGDLLIVMGRDHSRTYKVRCSRNGTVKRGKKLYCWQHTPRPKRKK